MKKITLLLLIALVISISIVGKYAFSDDNKNPILRVLILDNMDQISLTIKGSYKVYSINSDKLLTGGYILHTMVKGSEQGIMFGARDLKFSKIRPKSYGKV